jgi:signal transduction histidine kinase
MGLRSMRHHAELIEGQLEVESRTGEGTRIICRAPNELS